LKPAATVVRVNPPAAPPPWRRRPATWVLVAVVAAMCACPVWVAGAFAGGLDAGEACQRAGEPYDDAYRSAHWREPSQAFPLHNRCNAGHDLVPLWVNPLLDLLAVVALAGVALAIVRTVVAIRAGRD
jgi:hypothetical protein